MEKRILVISEIGAGPPFLGNRARLRSLLVEMRRLGWQIDFAGVRMADEERTGTLPFIDRWVWSFGPNFQQSLWSRYSRAILRRLAKVGIRPDSDAEDGVELNAELDHWFRPHWHLEARRLQKREKYQQVLVSYVFHSAFLMAFPPECLKLIDTHDVFTDRKERLASQGITNFWFSTRREVEKIGLRRADVILAIQAKEAEFFRGMLGADREVHTVGHFVDPVEVPRRAGAELQVGYIASDNPININAIEWFLSEVWPGVIEQVPAATLLIGGRICQSLAEAPSVKLLGELADLAEAHEQFAFSINPMTGGTGLKIKTVESMSYGRAVVGTPSAAEGLEAFEGRGLMTVTDVSHFIDTVIRWLREPEIPIQLGKECVAAMTEFNAISRHELALALRSISPVNDA